MRRDNMKKVILIISSILLINTMICFAEDEHTTNKSFIVNINDKVPTVQETNLTGVDNSFLPVKVIKYVDDSEFTLFTGNLGDYDDGQWSNTDFSKIQFLMLVDWNSDDVIYIIPTENIQTSRNAMIQQSPQMVEHTDFMNTNTVLLIPQLSITENYYVNGNDIENQAITSLSSGDTVLASYNVTNNGTVSQSTKLLICLYDNNSRLVTISTAEDIVNAGESKILNKNMTIPNNINNCYVKVMLWDGTNTLRPLHDSKQIGSASNTTSVINVNCTIDAEYTLLLTSNNVQAKNQKIYTVKYDPTKLEVNDLCTITYANELEIGKISSTNITITDFNKTSGTISFSNSDNSSVSVQKLLNCISFKSLASNSVSIITVE